ncbi:TolC family protein [Mucilaginibacter sp. KACC 22063]|uniref:TolC family protein n=1 Tax=Mucilaginibacter sp. KACC 22063 TaxID=3025666 RepID=UPI0023664454|nr:TolC family protein [Mucilaginibacter sp. KACC 22063]WDF56407.1 TolC family protein [Mucilaginibacter sp. KACC 22063]
MTHFFNLNKSKLLAFALLSLTVANKVKAQEKISLEKAVQYALDRNLQIKQSQFTEALANEDYKQAKFNLLPTLNGSAQGSYNFGRSPNLTTYSYTNQTFYYVNGQAQASVILFQGRQLHNQILQNKLILDADKNATAKVKNDLVLNVVTTYLSVLNNQDLVTASKQQIDIAKLTLDRTDKSFKVGNSTLADMSQAKAQLSTAELNYTTAQNQLELSILTLKQYMEMTPATEIEIDRPDVSKITDLKTIYDANDVINTALKINPDVVLAESQERTYEQQIKIARGAYYPTLSAYGSFGSNYSSVSQNVIGGQTITQQIGVVGGTNQPVFTSVTQPIIASHYPFSSQFGNNYNGSVGLNLQIPIFGRFQSRTNVRKAKLSYENAKLTTQLAKNTLTKTISQAVFDVQAAEKKYQSALQTYQANKDAYNVVQQRYNVGLVNSLDYNTSLTNLNKSQFDMISARYEMIFRAKVIDYYLGNPITL